MPKQDDIVVTPADLAALRSKYERILVLRTLHDRARVDPSAVEPDPQPAMEALAREFPGALREIDELPLTVIHGRIEALDRVAIPEPWMSAQILFHRYARGALMAKRWLARRRVITDELRDEFGRIASAEGLLWTTQLEQIAQPPDGRIMALVHARVAQALGIEVAAVQELLGLRGRARR